MTEALGNITSANAVAVLVVEDLYPAGIILENFTTDQAVDGEDHEYAQARMGVDGGLAAGFVPNPWNVVITLEACSPSLKVMQDLSQAMQTNRRIYEVQLIVTIPSLAQVHTYRKGVLVGGKDMPGLKRTLDPTSWRFTFAKYNQAHI